MNIISKPRKTNNSNTPVSQNIAVLIIMLPFIGLILLDATLIWKGFRNWPELTLLSLGLIGLIFMMSKLSPFKTKPADENKFTIAGTILRVLTAFAAPVVAAVVVNFQFISYRQGAGFLTALLGASVIMYALGKAMDIKALLANLSVCAAIAVGVYALPVPPSSPQPEFKHDVKTDVKLTFNLQNSDENPPESSISYTCFGILPKSWFTTRPLLYLDFTNTYIMDYMNPGLKLPYSPLGYVVEAHWVDKRTGKPRFSKAEVTNVFPGESRDVVINTSNTEEVLK